MSKFISIDCPYCHDANIIDIELYPGRFGLHHMCEMKNCEQIFAFDLEEVIVAVPYKTSHSGMQ